MRFGSRLVILSVLALLSGSAQLAAAQARAGAVYTSSNAAAGNALIGYRRAADGTLSYAGSFATDGLGAGAGLGSQGAIARQGELLFVVNAGSNDITTFSLKSGTPKRVAKTASGGVHPISLTVHGALLYVLNDGGAGSINGFYILPNGTLLAIGHSRQALSGSAVAPAEVAFSPDGATLVVTEKGSQKIDAFAVDLLGRAHAGQVVESSGVTPFGFAFTPRNQIIVSEAFGGAAGQAALSSYAISHRDEVTLVSASVPDEQTSACWVAVAPSGRYAFTANTGAGNVSAYSVAKNGAIDLIGDGVAGVTGAGSKPADLALTGDGSYLYVQDGGTHSITGFSVSGAKLELVEEVTHDAATPAGLAVY